MGTPSLGTFGPGRRVVGGFRPAARGSWSPRHPALAVAPEEGTRELDEGDGRFVPLPQSTHLLGVKFVRPARAVRELGLPVALVVRFKPSGGNGVTEYAYYGDPKRLSDIYDRLVASPHPWRLVGYPELADPAAGVQYKRLS